MISKENFDLLYRYLAVSNEPEKADMIFVFGGISMPEVWHKALELYQAGCAKKIYIAGGLGEKSRANNIRTPEAETIKKFLVDRGVPSESVIVESESTNTLENVVKARDALQSVTKIIAVSKPFHMRRVLATFAKHQPGLKVLCCSPDIKYAKLAKEQRKYYYERMRGELDRLNAYAMKGDIEFQEIPPALISRP